MSDYAECRCERGYYDPDEYNSCYTCFLERRGSYVECIWCERWHSAEYATCYRCRTASRDRDEAGRNLRLDILIRDDFTCRCGSSELPQVDHIKPCAKGGQAMPWKLQVLCRECNQDKGRYWQPGSRWDDIRIRLMHTYFTYGWGLLDTAQQAQLVKDAGIYSDEFTWHAHFKPQHGGLADTPEMQRIADTDTAESRSDDQPLLTHPQGAPGRLRSQSGRHGGQVLEGHKQALPRQSGVRRVPVSDGRRSDGDTPQLPLFDRTGV